MYSFPDSGKGVLASGNYLVADFLAEVGIAHPGATFKRFPDPLFVGVRQRVQSGQRICFPGLH